MAPHQPRSIRNKAYIILKRSQNPLHFVDIANKITEAGFDKKLVTSRAVHNELLRYDQFVLVGPGTPSRNGVTAKAPSPTSSKSCSARKIQ